MQKIELSRLRPSFSLSAGALTQLLAAVACFLGAIVLPLTMPDFGEQSRLILVVLGCVMLVVGVLNLMFGKQIGRLLNRAGKRSRVVVPREGIACLAMMLVLAVGALLGHRNMPLLVFGMLAGPFVLNGWIVYGMLKSVTVNRQMPRRAIAGNFVGIEIQVHNSKRVMASHMLEVRDSVAGEELKNNSHDEEGSVTFVRVPAGESRIGRYQLRFAKRGRYRLGPLRISSRFPLGIGERGQIFNDVAELIVHPELGRLLPAWSRQQKEMAESSSRVRAQQGLFDDEFHRIREYREDDNPRSIHWRSSARRGRLMVREYQQQRHADSLIVLDLPSQADWSAEAREMSISLAATVCVEQSRAASGDRFILAIAGESPLIVSSRSPGGFREESLDALAVCRPGPQSTLQLLLLQLVQQHGIGDRRLLLITPRPNEVLGLLLQVTTECERDNVDLVMQTTLVEATPETLQQVFELEGSANHNTPPPHKTSASRNHASDNRRTLPENSLQGIPVATKEAP